MSKKVFISKDTIISHRIPGETFENVFFRLLEVNTAKFIKVTENPEKDGFDIEYE